MGTIKSAATPGAVGGRIRKIRGGRTLMEFARLIGVSHTSVSRYEHGVTPDIRALLRIAEVGKVDLGWLLLGEPLPEDVRERRPLRFVVGHKAAKLPGEADFVMAPLVSGAIAAGSPRVMEEDVEDYVLVNARLARRARGAADLVACRVEGDSMEPVLRSGDIAVINRGFEPWSFDERLIYAVRVGEGVTAKLIQRDGALLLLIPYNRRERTQSVDLRVTENPVIGPIIASWRDLSRGVW